MADSRLLKEEDFDVESIDGYDLDNQRPSRWLIPHGRQFSFSSRWSIWIIHLLFFSINVSVLMMLVWRGTTLAETPSLKSELFFFRNIQFESVFRRIGDVTDFQGRPSSVNDNQWNTMLWSAYPFDISNLQLGSKY